MTEIYIEDGYYTVKYASGGFNRGSSLAAILTYAGFNFIDTHNDPEESYVWEESYIWEFSL